MTDHLSVLFTCEHGGNRIPEEYRQLFRGHEELLQTHRGYDIGALELAEQLAREFDAPLEASTVTRLLVDLNRSATNRRSLFSEISRQLSPAGRETALATYYRPYRQRVRNRVAAWLGEGRTVFHLAVHAFTPELDGEVRNADLGLMYDPSRPLEKAFCLCWQQLLGRIDPAVRVRRNYPYRGVDDGIVHALRCEFANDRYLGLQIEVNQRYPQEIPTVWQRLQQEIIASLQPLIQEVPGLPPTCRGLLAGQNANRIAMF